MLGPMEAASARFPALAPPEIVGQDVGGAAAHFARILGPDTLSPIAITTGLSQEKIGKPCAMVRWYRDLGVYKPYRFNF